MTEPEFHVGVRPLAEGVVLDLAGPLGQEGGDLIRQTVAGLERLPAHLVINFADAFPMSTAGVGAILFVVRQVVKAGGRASAFGLSDHYRRVFHVMGLNQYIRICVDEAAALE